MKKRLSKHRQQPEPPTTAQICDIWEKIRSDTDARGALERLDRAGFRISHLKPVDATFKQPSWADYVAALPLLPNKPSTRRIYHKSSFRKCLPLVQELRQVAAEMKMPFVDVTIFGKRDYALTDIRTLQEDLLKAAEMLEHFLSWDYYVRYVNPRNAAIAELRWMIRHRTGKPHDRELSVLIDAAFRAAGIEEGCYIDANTLDRIEKRQRESRVKANRRIRSITSPSSPTFRRSTRIRRNSKKRV
jgi:hypothetical protein